MSDPRAILEKMDEDDGVGFFNMFGDDAEEEVETKVETKVEDVKPSKIKDDTCPIDDPNGALVRIHYEGDLFPATVKSYEADSNTYTIVWKSSGIIQYRTKPEDINWAAFEYVEEKKEEKKEEDELWIAARRGSLASVKRFVESGVNFNDTGKSQQRTPFYHAVFCGHTKVVEYLISLGATDSDDTAFITANPEIREILIRTGTGGKRRGSVKKVEHPLSEETKTEMRRASISKVAKVTIDSLQGEVTTSQLNALKQLEERLLAVEAALKTETRKQSMARKNSVSTKKVTIDDSSVSTKPGAASKNVLSPSDTTGDLKTASCKLDQAVVVARPKRIRNPVVRFFVSLVPKRLFGQRKRQ